MKNLVIYQKIYIPARANCSEAQKLAKDYILMGSRAGEEKMEIVSTLGTSYVAKKTLGLIGKLIKKVEGECNFFEYGTPYQPVVIELTVKNATVNYFTIPGAKKSITPFEALKFPSMVYNFSHPDTSKIMLVSHRGYFKDVAENTLKAVRLAIEMGLPMIELDIALTKDSVWVLSHDKALGQTARTIVPSRLGSGQIAINTLTLADLRPNLSTTNEGCTCDPLTGTWGGDATKCKPVMMNNMEEGAQAQPIATLEEALKLCKGKVMVNLDKIELSSKSNTRNECPYHLVWSDVMNTGTIGQVIVKGKNWKSSQMLRDSFPSIDWRHLMYTPTFFPDFSADLISTTAIDGWLNDSKFNCPGFELIYYKVGDNLFQRIQYIKSKGAHVIQFPMWPESAQQVIADGTCRTDKRNNWSWLLNYPGHRPTLIISDRLEVLYDLLKRNDLIAK